MVEGVWDEQEGGSLLHKVGALYCKAAFVFWTWGEAALQMSQGHWGCFRCRWWGRPGCSPWRQEERTGEESLEEQLDFFLTR